MLLDAMATGTPVIAARVGGAIDVVQDHATGELVEPNRPSELADAMTRLCEDDDARARMGVGGRRLAELLDWNLVSSRVERLYREICSDGREWIGVTTDRDG